jgi:hypothetical protein
VAGLFGPESGTTSSHVQSICDAMEIPHIETRWDYLNKRDDYSINLYPSPKQISRVRTTNIFAIFSDLSLNILICTMKISGLMELLCVGQLKCILTNLK